MKFIDVIFCDDIRPELNNKFSLMGLYNDRMILNVGKQTGIKWPQPINLAALLRFAIDKNDKQPDRFEFEYILNKKSIIEINNELNINSTDTSQFQLIINGSGLPLGPGNLGFSIKLYAKNNLIFTEKQENAFKILIA